MNYKRITKYVFFLILISSSIACTDSKVKLTIPEDKLIKVFFDLYAADNAIKESPKEKRDSLKEEYTKQIFQIHHINQNEFEKNLNQLQKNPERFKKFYDKLDKYVEELSKEDPIIENEKKE